MSKAHRTAQRIVWATIIAIYTLGCIVLPVVAEKHSAHHARNAE